MERIIKAVKRDRKGGIEGRIVIVIREGVIGIRKGKNDLLIVFRINYLHY